MSGHYLITRTRRSIYWHMKEHMRSAKQLHTKPFLNFPHSKAHWDYKPPVYDTEFQQAYSENPRVATPEMTRAFLRGKNVNNERLLSREYLGPHFYIELVPSHYLRALTELMKKETNFWGSELELFKNYHTLPPPHISSLLLLRYFAQAGAVMPEFKICGLAAFGRPKLNHQKLFDFAAGYDSFDQRAITFECYGIGKKIPWPHDMKLEAPNARRDIQKLWGIQVATPPPINLNITPSSASIPDKRNPKKHNTANWSQSFRDNLQHREQKRNTNLRRKEWEKIPEDYY